MMMLVCMTSCKKLIEVDTPKNQLTTETVFSDSKTALAALVNIYALFNNTLDGNYTTYMEMYSDELSYSSTGAQQLEFLRSSVSSINSSSQVIWKNYFFVIYSCNSLIEQLTATDQIQAGTVKQYVSEAKFLRAFAYFYLVNLYDRIPLVLGTDVNTNASAPQVDAAVIYNQMIQDLTDAQNGLSPAYIGNGKVRVNQLAATALLARVYLFQKDWVKAEAAASTVITSGFYLPLGSPSTVFLAGSKETILQFWTQNGFIARAPSLIPSLATSRPTYPLSTNLISSFEPGDLRKSNWTKSNTVSGTVYYYPYKYHNRTANTSAPEYLMALRLGEQYLIRAEARINQAGKIADGIADLNIIRSRSRDAATIAVPNPLPTLNTGLSKAEALVALQHERQIELVSEWGNRFLDLKRNGLANAVLVAYKTTWKTDISLALPIPQSEINTNPSLRQNQGY